MNITEYFETLRTKDIICWGSGKHFRNITCPFLCNSGLIENLKGFVGGSDKENVEIQGRFYEVLGNEKLGKDSRWNFN